MTIQNEPVSNDGLIRIRLDLGYNGTGYFGWAKQPNGLKTIQGELESALIAITGLAEVKTIVGGRTDAGVHARGQVCHIDLPVEFVNEQISRLGRRLRAVLPESIVVSQVTQVSKNFDARFAALARRYSYRIADRSVDPLTLSSVMIHDAPLDLDAMNAASKLLQGLNDFTAYCKANTVGTRIRELQEFSWHRHDDLVIATVKADAFCYSMVRTLVGALIPVGDGRKDIEWPYRILKAAQKIFEINVAPGHALVLEEIYYPAEKEFADRVSSTKAMRSPEEVE